MCLTAERFLGCESQSGNLKPWVRHIKLFWVVASMSKVSLISVGFGSNIEDKRLAVLITPKEGPPGMICSLWLWPVAEA